MRIAAECIRCTQAVPPLLHPHGTRRKLRPRPYRRPQKGVKVSAPAQKCPARPALTPQRRAPTLCGVAPRRPAVPPSPLVISPPQVRPPPPLGAGGGGIAPHNGSTKTAAVPVCHKENCSLAPGISCAFFVKATVPPPRGGRVPWSGMCLSKGGGGDLAAPLPPTTPQANPPHHPKPKTISSRKNEILDREPKTRGPFFCPRTHPPPPGPIGQTLSTTLPLVPHLQRLQQLGVLPRRGHPQGGRQHVVDGLQRVLQRVPAAAHHIEVLGVGICRGGAQGVRGCHRAVGRAQRRPR